MMGSLLNALVGVLCLLLCGFLAGCAPREEAVSFDNLILVTIDTLRADRLGSYGYPRPVSPFLDSLAAEGVRFHQVIAASSHTAPSHATIFTSQYPTRHGVDRNGVKLDPAVPTLAQQLGAAGFDTAAFVSMGFLKSVSPGFELVDAVHGPDYRPADVIVDAARDWVDARSNQGRFFLWVHLFDVHNSDGQLAVPESHYQRMKADAAERGRAFPEFLIREQGIPAATVESDLERHNRYDAQIALVDENLSRLFAGVEERVDQDRTLWVVIGDHGEGLGNHGYNGHGRFIYEEQLRVPLIVYGGEGWLENRIVDQMVRHVDLWPTLAELLEVPLDSQALELEGRSLVPVMRNPQTEMRIDYAVSQRRPADSQRLEGGWEDGLVMAVQGQGYKFIYHSASESELYHLEKDPFETINLIGQGLPIEKKLADWLLAKQAWMRRHPIGRGGEELQIEEEFVEELEALGYLN